MNTLELQGLASWANDSIAKEQHTLIPRKQQINDKVSIIHVAEIPSRQNSLDSLLIKDMQAGEKTRKLDVGATADKDAPRIESKQEAIKETRQERASSMKS